MKSSNRLTTLIWFLIWLFVVLGCATGGSSHVDMEKWGCITPDSSKIGIANRNTTALIDADSGQLLKSEKMNAEGGVVCLSNNKVIAIYPEAAIDLTGSERVQRNKKTFTVFGASGNEGIVHYSGGKLSSSKSSFSRPIEVYFEKFGAIDTEPKLLEIPFVKFNGLITNTNSYWVIPVRVLDNGKLLVAAGTRPSYSAGTSRKTTVNPDPWGFFTINPSTGEVENYGAVKVQDSEINFVYVPKTYATTDGKFAALTSSVGGSVAFAVWSVESDKEIFRKSLPDSGEILDVILDANGNHAAILGRFQNEYKIRVYNIAEKREINDFSFSQSSTQFINLNDNELTLSDYDGLVSKINIQTGQKIWEWKYLPSK